MKKEMYDRSTPYGNWPERIAPCLRPTMERSFTGHHALDFSEWLLPRRMIYDHELWVFRKGSFMLEMEGMKYPCEEGTYIIIPPGKYHSAHNVKKHTGQRYWSHFDWIFQEGYQDAPIETYYPGKPRWDKVRHAPRFVPHKILHGPIASMDKVIRIFDRLCLIMKNGNYRNQLMGKSLLLEILLELLVPLDPHAPLQGSSVRLATQTRALLDEVIQGKRPFTPIQSLLSQLGYSYAHLCRIFKNEYGIPPLKYLHQARIEQAKRIFQETTLNVSQTAFKLGFEDAFYFSQLFKKITGHSPSAFRKL